MKYLIVGLGNIGDEYAGTRHNIGFMILDAFAKASNISFSTDRYGDVAHMRLKNKQLTLLKPSTYMNLSGNAVRYWKDKENIDIDHILVLVDDLALPFGAIRLKGNGSDAGHNGLKNIAAMLGTQAYPRLRFGIGNDYPKGAQIDYSLGKFTPEQQQELPARIEVACEAIKAFCLSGISFAMCNFKNKKNTRLMAKTEERIDKWMWAT
ncbi:MAG: aminoacyl-tRNA hydrolase, partial [Paramuribaculum sp.]|nr:aminoacyl-tRNA hydrolase [Paramuribaculum sp.]